MTDNLRTASGTGEDNSGIPDDLRCKRSDGKQWRCTAMSMPDKTVCEKHYFQAKKRAANSALRASMKKAKRKSQRETDIDLESKSDDMDLPRANSEAGDYDFPATALVSGKKSKEKVSNSQYEENMKSYRTTPPSTVESSKSKPQKTIDASPTPETSDASSNSSSDAGGQTCHQCRRNDRDKVVWCLRCDRRGYCDSCVSTCYSHIPSEEIQRACPACRGSCNCKACLRSDNLIKVKIREIPVQEKLEYLYCLLSSVLPVVKRIHREQYFEVELERRLRGNELDLARTKLNADEQMCCDFCRIPIIDYHRHCMNCSYDICLSCCQDLRESYMPGGETGMEDQNGGRSDVKDSELESVKPSKIRVKVLDKLSGWQANSNGSIPCPPKEYGGCGCLSLTLKRIFKMNWVAKLVKNVEEMVSGCKICDASSAQETGFKFGCQFAHRENSNDNFLYCPSSQDIKTDGIRDFRKHWIRGEPVIVNEVCDTSSLSSWDPMVIWRGIQETTQEKLKDNNTTVKAVDCLDWSEVDIELGQFIKGYSEGRIRENGSPEMLKSKNWPSPNALEEFLLYQRPDFFNKLPLLEYIHSKFGLLNVAAKLPHYSLQNDAGPKISISYGTHEELGQGDSVNNLLVNMRDMVYLMVHTCELKLKDGPRTRIEKIQRSFEESKEEKILPRDPETSLNDRLNEQEASLIKDEKMEDQGILSTSEIGTSCLDLNGSDSGTSEKSSPGAIWDVFRRQDISKLTDYLRVHWSEFGKPDKLINDTVPRPLYDGVIFLNIHHKRKLKEEFGVEPWSFDQHFGQAVFIPAGCPFQVKNLQSNVQLGLDFLSPESLGEAVRLADEIRALPNDHDAKLQMLEVGKISLYASSSAIKEVQKLVLDPKLGVELGFEDPNLTALVSENLEKMIKRRQIACFN